MHRTGMQEEVAISGNYVIWTDHRDSLPGDLDMEIWGHDLAENRAFPITAFDGLCDEPDIDGNLVVFDYYGNTYGVYIPEPAAMALLLIGGVAFLRPRRSGR